MAMPGTVGTNRHTYEEEENEQAHLILPGAAMVLFALGRLLKPLDYVGALAQQHGRLTIYVRVPSARFC
jgi:hypothetical protein